MHYSLEMLVHGNPNIVGFYQAAAKRWEEIWSRPESRELKSFANLLDREQDWFEKNCGGRWVGQEVMVVSGMAGLYSTKAGFRANLARARLLYDAFMSSSCRVEVKIIAEQMARSYDILETSRV
jgi:hypothetical protein